MTVPSQNGPDHPEPERPPLSPLDVARLHFRIVEAFAEKYGGDDPDTQLKAYIDHAGRRQWEHLQSAAALSLISMAEDIHAAREDLHRLVGLLGGIEVKGPPDA